MTDPTTETTRYRKKPIPVEARQVPPSKDGQSGLDLAAWCGGSVSGTYAEPKIFVPTLESELVARVGDWIVKGTRGEFWPVKGDIFAETYELATEPPQPDTCRSVDVDGEPVLVRGSGDFTEQDAQFFREVVRAAKRKYEAEHGPATDEDAQRTDRRETIRLLLARLDRGNLTTGECHAIRKHVETEIREADTERAVAAGNLRHVKELVPEIDRLTAEVEQQQEVMTRARDRLEEAQARTGRVRALASQWSVLRAHGSAAVELRAALDGTEQPTTTEDGTP